MIYPAKAGKHLGDCFSFCKATSPFSTVAAKPRQTIPMIGISPSRGRPWWMPCGDGIGRGSVGGDLNAWGDMPKISDGRLALGLAAAFAIWLFAVLPFLYGPPPRFAETSSPPQAHTDQAAQQSAAKPDGSVTAPFFIRIPKTANEEAEEASDRREKSSTDRWLMIFTGAVALFTLLLVGATVMLYLAGEKQLRLASETSKRQSDEMLKSIAVAHRSATVAENALIATDRAWISIKAEIFGNLFFEKDRIHIDIRFNMTNVGKSPATHVEIRAELCPDMIAAKERGTKSVEFSRLTIFDFGVVLFHGEVERRDWLEMEMSADIFKQNIAEGMNRAKERGDNESEWATAWPCIMACATYRLAGSSKPHHTIILFEIQHVNAPNAGWDGRVEDIDAPYLKLVQTFMSGQVT
jgi:hypothetical protein